MSLARLDGLPVFGLAVEMESGAFPRESQENSFFGLSGVESLDGGSRGRETRGRCLVFGADAGQLAAAVSNLEGFRDGGVHTLTDTIGRTWSNVRVDSLAPKGRIFQGPDGTLYQPFEFTLRHLTET